MTEEQNQGGGFQRQMYDVDEKCGKCGGEIKQLPFQPDPARASQLVCRECYKKSKA